MLKILHTSDWHLGARLCRKSLHDEHEAFLNFLLETIQEKEIDVLVVAGDIFHTPYPDHASLRLYYNFLASLTKTGCKQAVLLAGNHDSPSLLEGPSKILSHFEIHIITQYDALPIPLIKNGEQKAILAPIPFLRAGDLPLVEGGMTSENFSEKVRFQVKQAYKRYWEKHRDTPLPIIGTGHLYVKKSLEKDSTMLFSDSHTLTPKELPAPFSYFALGHLHTCHSVEEGIWYSGSPIPLSFQEGKSPRYVLEVAMDKKGVEEIRKIEVPTYRNILSIEGTFESVKKELEALPKTSPTPYAEVVFHKEEKTPFFHTQVKELFSSLEHIEVLKYDIRQSSKAPLEKPREATRLDSLTPIEIFSQLLASEGCEAEFDRLAPLFMELAGEIHT